MTKRYLIIMLGLAALLVGGYIAEIECSDAAVLFQDNYAKWHEWIARQQDYLDKVESLIKKSDAVAIEQDTGLGAAIRVGDRVRGEQVIGESTKKMSAVIDALKAITPPKEFREYHDKVIEAYKYRQMASEASLKRDVINIRNYSHMAVTSETEAMETIKKLYISHDAPPNIIDSIDKNIAAYKQRLMTN